MITDFIFTYGKSVNNYDSKPTKKPFKWIETKGTVNDLITDIIRGHAYCSLFHHGEKELTEIEQKRKAKDGKRYRPLEPLADNEFTTYHHTEYYFKCTNIISFDFDKCITTAYECYNKLHGTDIEPTFIYTSCSNGTTITDEKHQRNGQINNAYRLVYIVDKPITNGNQYTNIHNSLKGDIMQVLNDSTIYNDKSDNNGKVERAYYGNGSDIVEYYPNGYNFKVYSLAELVDKYDYDDIPFNYTASAFSINTDTPIKTNTDSKYMQMESQQRTNGRHIQREKEVIYDRRHANETLLLRHENKYKEFFQAFENQANTIESLNAWTKRVPLLPTATPLKHYYRYNDPSKLYVEVDDTYFEIIEKRERVNYTFITGNTETIWRVKRFMDGEQRRMKLFNHLMMLRRITPNASREQLTLNAVNFIYRCIDNSKDPITKDDIKEKVDKVLNNEKEYEYDRKGKFKRQYKVEPKRAKALGLDNKQAALKARNERATDRKNIKWKKIEEVYDPNKTNEEMAVILQANGIEGITPTYIQAWRRENGIQSHTKKTKLKVIAENYDTKISASQNYENMKSKGLEVSRAGVFRYAKEQGFTNISKQETAKDVHNKFNELLELLPATEKKKQQGQNIDDLGMIVKGDYDTDKETKEVINNKQKFCSEY